MKTPKIIFFIWRMWLWFTVMFGLILFSPFGMILISFEKTYPLFHLFCKYWCRVVLFLNGFWYKLHKESYIDSKSAYIICPNHTSKFDIILLFAIFPGTFVFLGKKNVSNISFFEWFYNKTMVTFERGQISSSVNAYRKADRLLKRGISIVVFPEGRVPEPEIILGKFKLGAFKLAINNQIPIIPLTFVDNKRKYPEDKLRVKLGFLRVIMHKPIKTFAKTVKESVVLKDKVFDIIYKTLIKYENN
ncbi:MAG: hypothetical protein CMP56_01925 [Flavobacteriales bacterium]|nr:hypothetical protein [Flavobacteriales bacterium]